MLERLSRSFEVEREVWGTHCTGRRMRIDAVLRPRDSDQWKNPDVAFGVEFKYPQATDNPGIRNYTSWAAQAIDYSHTEWDNYGRLFIFTCPAVSSRFEGFDPDNTENVSFYISHLLGQFGIGELFLFLGYGLSFVLAGHHRVWCERDGVALDDTGT